MHMVGYGYISTPFLPRRFAWRPIWPSRPRAGRRRHPRAFPDPPMDPPDARPGDRPSISINKVELFSCNFHWILLFSELSAVMAAWPPVGGGRMIHTVNTITPWASPEATLAEGG